MRRTVDRCGRLGRIGRAWGAPLLLCSLLLAGVSSAHTSAGRAAAVTLIRSWQWNSGFGHPRRILSDSSNYALYVYCVVGHPGDCKHGHTAASRPPLIAHGRWEAGPGIDQSKLRTRLLADGERQVTYYGQPLYLYTGDREPHEVHGEVWAARCGARQWNALQTNGQPVYEPLKCGTPF